MTQAEQHVDLFGDRHRRPPAAINPGGQPHHVATGCAAPCGLLAKLEAMNLPIGDVMLAQKIALENDEQTALAVANRGFRNEGPSRFV